MARRARRHASEHRGFTILELLFVLAIMGLLLFLVVPNMDGMTPRYRLRSAARRIASTVELAQGQAIASQKEIVVAYDLDRQSFWIVLPAPDTAVPADPGAPAPPPIDLEHGLAPVLPEGTSGTKPATSTTASKSQTSYDGRETLGEETMPEDVQLESITLPDGKEVNSGRVYVPFSSLGDEGSHAVLVRLRDRNGVASHEEPIAVRFNALTRTIDFANEKLVWTKLDGN